MPIESFQEGSITSELSDLNSTGELFPPPGRETTRPDPCLKVLAVDFREKRGETL
jgi:hypothetical protein